MVYANLSLSSVVTALLVFLKDSPTHLLAKEKQKVRNIVHHTKLMVIHFMDVVSVVMFLSVSIEEILSFVLIMDLFGITFKA